MSLTAFCIFLVGRYDKREFLLPEDYERYKEFKRFPNSKFIMAHEY